jgi:hypothetical protein
VTQLTSIPHQLPDSRTRGSVRRVIGFVQVTISLLKDLE